MNLASRSRAAAPGLLLGALAAFLAIDLGLGSVFVGGPEGITILLAAAVIGAILAAGGQVRVIVAAGAVLLFTYLLIALSPIVARLSSSWVRNDSAHAPAQRGTSHVD